MVAVTLACSEPTISLTGLFFICAVSMMAVVARVSPTSNELSVGFTAPGIHVSESSELCARLDFTNTACGPCATRLGDIGSSEMCG